MSWHSKYEKYNLTPYFKLECVHKVVYTYNQEETRMIFEWDENKNKINKKKHDGVSFEIAARVFLDEKRIEKYEALNSKIDEDRYQAIGMVDEVLFVAFTERGADRIRIISARPAEQEEINEYFENYDAR